MSRRTPLSSEFKDLTTEIGVYALCDLDGVPIYVGQTVSKKERGILGRVRRHLTSARSDVIANLHLDVWELASVRAWPELDASKINELERVVHWNFRETILAGRSLVASNTMASLPEQAQVVNVLETHERDRRRDPRLRLPRQLWHVQHLLDVMLTRKDTEDMRRSLDKHMQRLEVRYKEFIRAEPDPEEPLPTGDEL